MIAIKDMEMPKEGRITIQIGADGAVYTVSSCKITAEKYEEKYPAIEVHEPHGDLIDMNAKIDVYDRYDDDIIRQTTVRGLINEYISGGYPSTVIPASEEE